MQKLEELLWKVEEKPMNENDVDINSIIGHGCRDIIMCCGGGGGNWWPTPSLNGALHC